MRNTKSTLQSIAPCERHPASAGRERENGFTRVASSPLALLPTSRSAVRISGFACSTRRERCGSTACGSRNAPDRHGNVAIRYLRFAIAFGDCVGNLRFAICDLRLHLGIARIGAFMWRRRPRRRALRRSRIGSRRNRGDGAPAVVRCAGGPQFIASFSKIRSDLILEFQQA